MVVQTQTTGAVHFFFKVHHAYYIRPIIKHYLHWKLRTISTFRRKKELLRLCFNNKFFHSVKFDLIKVSIFPCLFCCSYIIVWSIVERHLVDFLFR